MCKMIRTKLPGLAALAASLALAGCFEKQEAEAVNAIRAYGFDQVVLRGAAYNECGKDDAAGYRFTAKNVRGEPVTGILCVGMTKGYTVRISQWGE